MAGEKTVVWLERMIWALVYAGLIALIVGYRTHTDSAAAGWTLMVVGAISAVLGLFLIWVRSRVPDSTIDHKGDLP